LAGRLPLLLSVPHGGCSVPGEVAPDVVASDFDVLADGDAHTVELYALGEDVRHLVVADVARAFVDLNRAPDDRPPANPDGVVKTQTVHGAPIYSLPLRDDLAERLIRRYHAPYHARLTELASSGDAIIGIDCHSMLSEPPPGFSVREPRPVFCVSNVDGMSAPDGHLHALCDALREAFQLAERDVRANDPFRGGYIVRRHGRDPLPWLQLEINRACYLEPDSLELLATAGETRAALLDALRAFVAAVG
jgi:N-formylglutamate deformylase